MRRNRVKDLLDGAGYRRGSSLFAGRTRPRAWRDLRGPALCAHGQNAAQRLALRPGGRPLRACSGAGRRSSRRRRASAPASAGGRPAGADRRICRAWAASARHRAGARPRWDCRNPAPPTGPRCPIAERRLQLESKAARMFGGISRPVIRIALPEAPGADILLNRLASDWGTLGITVERAPAGTEADLKLLDSVAPSSSACLVPTSVPVRR